MNSEAFFAILKEKRINLISTLPCAKVKQIIAKIPADFKHVHLTREENGVGISAGAFLAGARPLMLIQSTGLGNSINALLSLTKTYEIPLPIIASWRGFYEEKIEAQKPLGTALPGILEASGIKTTLIKEPEESYKIKDVIEDAFDNNRAHIALVSPKIWEEERFSMEYPERAVRKSLSYNKEIMKPEMTRYEAIDTISKSLEDQAVVSNIGHPSKELFEINDRALNFYMTGSLGLVSSIGLGVSMFTNNEVYTIDGDGSLLMNPNVLESVALKKPENMTIFALDNGTHGSTGEQKTSAYSLIDLELVANSFGIKNTIKATTREELEAAIQNKRAGPRFVHVIVKPGHGDLKVITLSPLEIKERFMEAVKNVN